MHTWALAIDPADPATIFAGTQPSAVFRSRDSGQRWEKLAMELAEECPAVVIPRVTALVVDPEDHRTIWAGIEVDGVRRSLDGGDAWTTVAGGLDDPDIHGIAISGGQPKAVLATTPVRSSPWRVCGMVVRCGRVLGAAVTPRASRNAPGGSTPVACRLGPPTGKRTFDIPCSLSMPSTHDK